MANDILKYGAMALYAGSKTQVKLCHWLGSAHPCQMSSVSPSGNWTPVSCLLGKDAIHYTNKERIDFTHILFLKIYGIGKQEELVNRNKWSAT